jgi:hypothetical protein
LASNEAPPIAYGLLAWIEGACDWELNRRRGFDYTVQPPEAAIDSSVRDYVQNRRLRKAGVVMV